MYVIICDTIWNYGNQFSLRQVDANELLAVPPGTEVEMTPRDWYCAWCNCADVQAGAENCGATWGQQVQKPWTSNNINNRSAESFGSNCFSRSKFSLSQEDKDQQQLTKLDSSDETRRQNHLYLSILPRSYYGWIQKFHVTPRCSEATLNTPNTTGKFPNTPVTFSSLPAWWW